MRLVPHSKLAMEREISLFCLSHTGTRPGPRLFAATQDKVYDGLVPACAKPRFEPRRAWRAHSPDAAPHAKVGGRRGARLGLRGGCAAGWKNLPIITL